MPGLFRKAFLRVVKVIIMYINCQMQYPYLVSTVKLKSEPLFNKLVEITFYVLQCIFN